LIPTLGTHLTVLRRNLMCILVPAGAPGGFLLLPALWTVEGVVRRKAVAGLTQSVRRAKVVADVLVVDTHDVSARQRDGAERRVLQPVFLRVDELVDGHNVTHSLAAHVRFQLHPGTSIYDGAGPDEAISFRTRVLLDEQQPSGVGEAGVQVFRVDAFRSLAHGDKP